MLGNEWNVERLNRLRLSRSENIGPVTFRQLISQFGTATKVLDELPDIARRSGRRRNLRIFSSQQAHKEFDVAERLGIEYVVWGDDSYPPSLAAIPDAPPVLCVRGNIERLNTPSIAIVGARNASANGRKFAKQLAAELGQFELTVVSGMARGVDSAAHDGALNTGTVAVLAGGVDVIYPPENAKLYQSICEQGLVLSEYAPSVKPLARQFPRRNRIISGLSLAVIVVEAAQRSGSLITARYAAEQGRDVFAVPGSPLDPRAKGPNQLIRNGAALLECATDVLDAFPNLHAQFSKFASSPRQLELVPPQANIAIDDRARDVVITQIGSAPVSMDDLIRACGLTAAEVTAIVLELEISGRIDRHPGGAVSQVFPA